MTSMHCPTHIKKLQLILNPKAQRCEICNRPATLYCKQCPYVQCSQCRICNQRHHLVKIIELSKVKPEYYSNSYACNLCSKSKNVDDDGIWHCNSCNYDVCPQCLE